MARAEIATSSDLIQFLAERQDVVLKKRIELARAKKAQEDAAVRNLEDLKDGKTMHRGKEVMLKPAKARRKLHAVTQVGVPAEDVSRFLHPSAPETFTPQQVVLKARQRKSRR